MLKNIRFDEMIEKNNKALEGKIKLVPVIKMNEETGEVDYQVNYYSKKWNITRHKNSIGRDYYTLDGVFANVDGACIRVSQRITEADEDVLNYYKNDFLKKIMRNTSQEVSVRTRVMYRYFDNKLAVSVILLIADKVKMFIKVPVARVSIIEDSICNGKFFDIPFEKYNPREDEIETLEI